MKEREIKFKEAYETNYPKVMRLCLGYVGGDREIADDIVQEVFIRVWENLETFREESSIDTWIYRIAVNTCLGQLRKRKKEMRGYDMNRATEEPDVDSERNRERMMNQLYNCINTLTETNKAIILMELEGLPQKEIADVMGLKHEAIRTRVHRIKSQLTKCVQDD